MVTEKDILEYWGRKACGVDEAGQSSWKTSGSKFSERRRKVAESNNSQDFIDFAKYLIQIGKLHPFEYADQLKDLPNLEELKGEKVSNQLHPLWDKCANKVLKEWKPKTDTIVICSCSNLKPYIENPNYNFLVKRMNEGYCDVFINSIMLWPIEFSTWLYARVYDALECSEDPEYNKASIDKKIERTKKYLEKFGYKRVIIWQKPDYVYSTYANAIEEYCKENNIEFYDIFTKEEHEKLTEKLKNPGLASLRHWVQPELRRKFDLIIKYPNPTRIKTDEEIKRDREILEVKKQKKKEQITLNKVFSGQGFKFKEKNLKNKMLF